jgi:hypothetical protein
MQATMKIHRQLAVFTASCLAASWAALPADAGVVYGNLGDSGTAALSSTGYSPISETAWVAQGFSVGGTNNVLQTVTVGLSVEGAPTSATLRIFPSVGSNESMSPGGSALASSTQTVSETAPALLAFNFSGLTLTSGSTYWAVVSGGAFRWTDNAAAAAPLDKNGNNWQNPGTFDGVYGTAESANAGVTWIQSSSKQSASISITAIPEPSACLLAAIGVAAAGIMVARRNPWARRRSGTA